MDHLTRGDVYDLVRGARPPCVSVYAPVHGAASWMHHDMVTFKNLLVRAVKTLVARGMRRPDADSLLEPGSEILRDSFSWRGPEGGIAIFACPGTFRAFRLPVAFGAREVVADRFHVRRLLEVLAGQRSFYVLSLSTKGARLFRATRFRMSRVRMPSAPRDLSEELMYDDFEKHIEFHTRMPSGRGRRQAMFFGHGGAVEVAKKELLRYFRDVDAGLRDALGNEHAPVVLAGVDYFMSIFREASSCADLVKGGVSGSPQGMGERQLLERAWEIARPSLQRDEAVAVARYRASLGEGLASDHIAEVLRAASEGRVGVLLSARGREEWGAFKALTGRVETHAVPLPGDEDLAELAVAETIAHGGTAYAVDPDELPRDAAIAGVYRYAVAHREAA